MSKIYVPLQNPIYHISESNAESGAFTRKMSFIVNNWLKAVIYFRKKAPSLFDWPF